MLNEQSIHIANDIAEYLSPYGISLHAQNGSLLSYLTSASAVVTIPKNNDELVNFLTVATSGDISKPSIHSQLMDGYVSELKRLLTSHLSVARNTVKPIVKEYLDDAVEYTRQYFDISERIKSFSLDQIGVDPIFYNDTIKDMITKYARDNAQSSNYLKLNPKSLDEIKKMLLVGNEEVDKAITIWAENNSKELEALYACFFTSNFDTNYKVNSLSFFSNTTDVKYINQALAIFLMAQYLEVNIASDANVPLNIYRMTLLGYKEVTATYIVKAINRYESLVNSGVLVMRALTDARCITVLKDTYLQFKEKGLADEVLYALIVLPQFANGNNLIMLKDIEEQANELYKNFLEVLSLQEQSYRIKYSNDIKTYLISKLMMSMSKLTDVEQEFCKTTSGYKEEVISRAQSYISKLPVHITSDMLPELVLNLFSKCRFYFTGSYEILKEIQVSADKNPELDVRQHALCSAIYYLTDFFLGQLSIVRN